MFSSNFFRNPAPAAQEHLEELLKKSDHKLLMVMQYGLNH